MNSFVRSHLALFSILMGSIILLSFSVPPSWLQLEANSFEGVSYLPIRSKLGISLRKRVFTSKPANLPYTFSDENDYNNKWSIISYSGSLEYLNKAPRVHTEERLNVCIVTDRENQASVFINGQMDRYGSGKYNYYISKACPLVERRVNLVHITLAKVHEIRKELLNEKRIPAKKHFTMDVSFMNPTQMKETWDVVALTGDERCHIKDPRFDFRQYYEPSEAESLSSFSGNPIKTSFFMPLGARKEFQLIEANELKKVGEKKFWFNFVGSITSSSRKRLSRTLGKLSKTNVTNSAADVFLHIIDKWTDTMEGYLPPKEYRKVLLSSKFTLCPVGHNAETFRLYEAAMAGSIPILFLKEGYEKKTCSKAFTPFIEANAPFIYLENYDDLAGFLNEMKDKDEALIQQKSDDVVEWTNAFMSDFARDFEHVLESRYNSRIQNP